MLEKSGFRITINKIQYSNVVRAFTTKFGLCNSTSEKEKKRTHININHKGQKQKNNISNSI